MRICARSALFVAFLLAAPTLRAGQQTLPSVSPAVPASPLDPGYKELDAGRLDEATAIFAQALSTARSTGSRAAEAAALSAQGEVQDARHNYPQAIALYNQALALRRALLADGGPGAVANVAKTLDHLGSSYSNNDQNAQALAAYEEELPLRRQLHDVKHEANTLSHIASQYMAQSRFAEAIRLREQAATLFVAVSDARGEAVQLDEIGHAHDAMGEFALAVDYHQRALAAFRQAKDQRNEAQTLLSLSNSYVDLGDVSKAIGLLEQALVLNRLVKDSEYECYTLDSLGAAYNRTGDYEKAIESHTQALALAREMKSVSVEAGVLSNLSLVYKNLHQLPRAIELAKQVQAADHTIGYAYGEARALANLGEFYALTGDYLKAEAAEKQALSSTLASSDRQGEEILYTDLADAEDHLGHHDEALAHFAQSIALARDLKDRSNEGDAHYKLGRSLVSAGQYDAARPELEQALLLARAVKDRDREAQALNELATLALATHRPELAVFFGKQAVNTLQSIRADNTGLAGGLKQSFIDGSAATYQQLADTLMARGRLPEAQQVLQLLKEDEYFNFVRRDPAEAPAELRTVALSPEEADWNRRYADISTQVVALSSERDGLLQKAALTGDEKSRLATLDKDYELANQAFEKFLTRLASEKPSATSAVSLADLRDTTAMQQTLADLGHGAVAIYTLAGENTYRAILVTPSAQKGYEYPISAADLNRRIFAFRAALQDPEADPRPAAAELYKILVAPLEADLKQAHASTLMWSLDGTLRYIPLAALYDGRHYLVESYRTVVFTPASVTRLKDPPTAMLSAAGFGLSKSLQGAPALPGVPAELHGIIRDAGSMGVMNGEIHLDDAFTESALREAIRSGQFPVLHIATHFRLQPGNDASSFLLLGDGAHLSLADMGVRLKGLFRGVDLMTLSACETGVGGTGRDGHEVEGFGVLAQRNGAKSVVASLWSVADNSTSQFMQIFYRNIESHHDTKLDALRDAQLSLLYGAPTARHYPLGDASPARSLSPKPAATSGASFPTDQKMPFAHPFYWAPFFMMGNWL